MSDGVTSFLFQGSTPLQVPTGSDTTSTFPLWLQQANYNLANAATSLASSQYTPYPGPQVYTPSAQTQQSWNLAGSNVGNWQPSLGAAGALTSTAGTPISSNDINQFLNPYTNDVVGALQQASNKNFFTNVLPQVNDQFVSAGQSRSPQEMQATNNAIYNSQQALDQSTASALQSGYQGALTAAQQQKQQLQSAGAQEGQLGALTSQLGAYDVSALGNAGQQQDVLSQANINAGMQNFQNQLQWPYLNLSYASDITRGLAAPTSTQSVQTQIPSSSQLSASPIQTALQVGSLANSLGLAKGGRVGALTHYADGGEVNEDGESNVIGHEDILRIHRAINDPNWFPGKYARGGSVEHFDDGGSYDPSGGSGPTQVTNGAPATSQAFTAPMPQQQLSIDEINQILSSLPSSSGTNTGMSAPTTNTPTNTALMPTTNTAALGTAPTAPTSSTSPAIMSAPSISSIVQDLAGSGTSGLARGGRVRHFATGGVLTAAPELLAQTYGMGSGGGSQPAATAPTAMLGGGALTAPLGSFLNPPSSWGQGAQQVFSTIASPSTVSNLDPATANYLTALNGVDMSGYTPQQIQQMKDFAIVRQASGTGAAGSNSYVDTGASSADNFNSLPAWAQPSVLRLASSQLNVPLEAAGDPGLVDSSQAGSQITNMGLQPWWE